MEPSSHNPSAIRQKNLLGPFLSAAALGLLLVIAAAVGVATALPRIPSDALQHNAWAPVGERLPVVVKRTSGFVSQRHLNDFVFAVSAGVPLDKLPFHEAANILEEGSMVTVLRADLDYLQVKISDADPPLWIEARALGIEPLSRTKGRE